MFVKGISDPYARLRVCGQGRESGKSPVRRVEQAGKFSKKDTTPTKNNTLNPVWDDKNVFRAPMPLNDDSAGIVVELWDDDGLFFSADSLGFVKLTATELLNTTGGTLRRPLRPLPGGDAVTGWVEVRANVLAKITLHVLAARGLKKVDLLGKGDPYVVADWEGWSARRLGKTKTKYNTDKPKWNHAFELSVPLQRPGGRVKLEIFDYDAIGADDLLGRVSLDRRALLSGADERWVKLQDRPAPRGAKGKKLTKKEKRKAAEAAEKGAATGEIHLRISCAPQIAALTAVAARAKTLQRTQNELNSLAAVEIDIVRCKGLRKADRSGDSDPFVVVYRLGVHKSAKQVKREKKAKAAAQSGRRGCCGKSGGAAGAPEEEEDEAVAPAPEEGGGDENAQKETRIGRTRTIDNTLHPKWDPVETFRLDEVRTVLDANGDPPNDGVLLEAWDDDTLPHKRDFLGQARVEWEMMMTPGNHELELVDKTLEERARRKKKMPGCLKKLCKLIFCLPRLIYFCLSSVFGLCCKCFCFLVCPTSCQKKGCCGVCCSCCKSERPEMTGTITIRVRHIAKVELSVFEAFGLPKADLFGSSDPYATVRYLDKTLLKTRVKDNSCDPKWCVPRVWRTS